MLNNGLYFSKLTRDIRNYTEVDRSVLTGSFKYYN